MAALGFKGAFKSLHVHFNECLFQTKFLTVSTPSENNFAQKHTSQNDEYLVNLSSKTYVFEDKLTKY